jgi:hypothetical protein
MHATITPTSGTYPVMLHLQISCFRLYYTASKQQDMPAVWRLCSKALSPFRCHLAGTTCTAENGSTGDRTFSKVTAKVVKSYQEQSQLRCHGCVYVLVRVQGQLNALLRGYTSHDGKHGANHLPAHAQQSTA